MGSIPANSEAQTVPSFRRWRFEMTLSPPGAMYLVHLFSRFGEVDFFPHLPRMTILLLLQEYLFEGISELPVPSILRGFSAPVPAFSEKMTGISRAHIRLSLSCTFLRRALLNVCFDVDWNLNRQVKLVLAQTDEDLAFLMGHDTDRLFVNLQQFQ
jgi:hypothetical protein